MENESNVVNQAWRRVCTFKIKVVHFQPRENKMRHSALRFIYFSCSNAELLARMCTYLGFVLQFPLLEFKYFYPFMPWVLIFFVMLAACAAVNRSIFPCQNTVYFGRSFLQECGKCVVSLISLLIFSLLYSKIV